MAEKNSKVLKMLNDEKESLKTQKDEIESLKNTIARLKDENKLLRDENIRLSNEAGRLIEETKSLEDRSKSFEMKNVKLVSVNKNLESTNVRLRNVKKDLENANARLKDKNEFLESIQVMQREENEDLESKNARLSEENISLKDENTSLKDENISLKKNIDELKKEDESLKDENERLQKLWDLYVILTNENSKDADVQNKGVKEYDVKRANMDADSHEKPKMKQNLKTDNIYGHLHQELEELVETAHEIHNICFDKIQDCYKKIQKEITLPIDIEMVAQTLGIDIEYDNLNLMEQKRIDQNIAQLYYEVSGNTVKRKILVDNSTRSNKSESLSNLEKYAVAYELGKIIIGNEEKIKPGRVRKMNLESRPYSLPRLSARLENFEYEMCAIFLLLPMDLFFKEFQNYLDEINDHPVLMDLWIEHLSEKACIPGYQLINGYQYIKFSAYRYFAMHLSKKTVDGIDYRELYNV